MSAWKAKRFWKEAQVVPQETGFSVTLDGRPVRTPAKAPLVVPHRGLAEAIAAEWNAQSDEVDPVAMPFTRSANAAIDKVAVQREEVIDLIADYGGSDLICYRAEAPEALVRRQAQHWDPLLAFSAETLKAPLVATIGVVPHAQDAQSLARLRAHVAALDNFELTAFYDLVSLSGSLIIGFAVLHRADTAESLWRISRIDELWQEEQWGADAEATATAEAKRNAFMQAERFFLLSQRAFVNDSGLE